MEYSSPVHRARKPVYELSLSIYPVSVCGEDLQTGSPIEVSEKGEDHFGLVCRIDELILSTECEGKCFVEILVTENGKYCDRDECWCFVDRSENTVDIGD